MSRVQDQQNIATLKEERQAKKEHKKEETELMDRRRITTAARTRRADENPKCSSGSTFDEMMKQKLRRTREKKFLEPKQRCSTCGTEVDDFMVTTLSTGLKVCNECYDRAGGNASAINWTYVHI